MNQTIVVAGASGYVGRHVVDALDARGYRVHALVRSREKAEALAPSVPRPSRGGLPSGQSLTTSSRSKCAGCARARIGSFPC